MKQTFNSNKNIAQVITRDDEEKGIVERLDVTFNEGEIFPFYFELTRPMIVSTTNARMLGEWIAGKAK